MLHAKAKTCISVHRKSALNDIWADPSIIFSGRPTWPKLIIMTIALYMLICIMVQSDNLALTCLHMVLALWWCAPIYKVHWVTKILYILIWYVSCYIVLVARGNSLLVARGPLVAIAMTTSGILVVIVGWCSIWFLISCDVMVTKMCDIIRSVAMVTGWRDLC